MRLATLYALLGNNLLATNPSLYMPQATALQSWLTFAVVKSTTFLLVRSHLFPTSNLLTFVLAYRSISCSHVFTFANDSYKKGGRRRKREERERRGGRREIKVHS